MLCLFGNGVILVRACWNINQRDQNISGLIASLAFHSYWLNQNTMTCTKQSLMQSVIDLLWVFLRRLICALLRFILYIQAWVSYSAHLCCSFSGSWRWQAIAPTSPLLGLGAWLLKALWTHWVCRSSACHMVSHCYEIQFLNPYPQLTWICMYEVDFYLPMVSPWVFASVTLTSCLRQMTDPGTGHVEHKKPSEHCFSLSVREQTSAGCTRDSSPSLTNAHQWDELRSLDFESIFITPSALGLQLWLSDWMASERQFIYDALHWRTIKNVGEQGPWKDLS